MSRTLTLSILSLLLLSACSGATTSANKNPLTASRYGDELADTLANLVIQQDPIAKDPAMRALIDSEIAKAKKIGESARETQSQGTRGTFTPIKEQPFGQALYVSNMLYLSTDFASAPGPNLHLYITQVVDPRDAAFPDKTAIDLGEIKSAYGAQEYRVLSQEKPELLRTVVLYDTVLKRLYSFAQLSK